MRSPGCGWSAWSSSHQVPIDARAEAASGSVVTGTRSRLRVWTKASQTPLLCGLLGRARQGLRPSWREDAGLAGGVGRPVVAQDLDGRARVAGPEAALDGLEHHVPGRPSRRPRGWPRRGPGDALPVAGVDEEGAAHDLAVSEPGELEAVGTPLEVRAQSDAPAVMGMVAPHGVAACEERVVRLHDAAGPLVVHGGDAVCPELAFAGRRDAHGGRRSAALPRGR